MGFLGIGGPSKKKQAKWAHKEAMHEDKWNAFNTAYANGMDPRESAFGMVSNTVGSLTNMGSSIFGKGSNPTNAVYGGQNLLNGGRGGGGNTIMYVVLAILAFMMFKK